MPDLWTPGQRRGRGVATLFVPRGYESDAADAPKPRYVCRVPTGPGETCGHPFFDGEENAYEAHVGRCAREHMDAIRDESPRTRMPWTDEENWDPEFAAHMAKIGQRMIREGRLEMRPNER